MRPVVVVAAAAAAVKLALSASQPPVQGLYQWTSNLPIPLLV
jgi:hypothetical protein